MTRREMQDLKGSEQKKDRDKRKSRKRNWQSIPRRNSHGMRTTVRERE